MCFGEDQLANISKDNFLKEIGLCLQILIPTPDSKVNTVGRTYLYSHQIIKHGLPTIITKSREV
jgi:hypothetical protein